MKKQRFSRLTATNYMIFCKRCNVKPCHFKSLKYFLNLWKTDLYNVYDIIELYKKEN